MNGVNNFTLLRLVLAIMIVVTHAYGITGHAYDQPLMMPGEKWGSARLNIFFFISGYLVTASALKTSTTLSFLAKRVLRIYPALIIAVLVTVFVIGPLFTTLGTTAYFSNPLAWKYLLSMSAFHIEYYLPGVFTANIDKTVNSSLWTLTLELKLYLLLVLCRVTGLIFTGYYKFFAIGTAILFLLFSFTNFTIPGTSYNAGKWALMAIYQVGSLMQVYKLSFKRLMVVFTASAGIIFLRAMNLVPYKLYADEVVFYSCLTLLLAYYVKIEFRLKNDYSYGLYIYAFPVQQALIQLSANKMHPTLNIICTLIIAGALAVLSWHYVEKPMLSLKKYL